MHQTNALFFFSIQEPHLKKRQGNDTIKSPGQTKYQRLGPIFGTPIPSLDPSVLPQKIDVIKFWMFLYDKARSSYKMSSAEKNLVKEDLLTSLVSIWESKGLKILNKRGLESKYHRLIAMADYLGQDPRCRQGYI